MIDVKPNGNTELCNELHDLLIKVNNFIQSPESNSLVRLVSDDLKHEYGIQRIEETAQVVLAEIDGGFPALSRKFTDLFRVFNERYFDGGLPDYTVRILPTVNHFETASIWRGPRIIDMLVSSEPRMVCRLLDEMGRVATTDAYGDEWNTEMNRLMEAGAPIILYRDMEAMSAEEFIKAATYEEADANDNETVSCQ